MGEPTRARGQCCVDEEGVHFEEELYAGDADEEFATDRGPGRCAENDDAWRDCEGSY